MYLHKYIHEDPETTEKRRYPSAPFCKASALFRSLGNGPRKFLYYHTPQVNATTICRRFKIGVVAGGGPLGTGVMDHSDYLHYENNLKYVRIRYVLYV